VLEAHLDAGRLVSLRVHLMDQAGHPGRDVTGELGHADHAVPVAVGVLTERLQKHLSECSVLPVTVLDRVLFSARRREHRHICRRQRGAQLARINRGVGAVFCDSPRATGIQQHQHPAALGQAQQLRPKVANLDGAGLALVGQDLGIRQARRIIDGDVQVFPADAAVAVDHAGAAARDAVPDAGDPAELLGVDVDEFAGALALVAHDRRRRIEALEAAETEATQDGFRRSRAACQGGAVAVRAAAV
jgi:hypothetical protein